MAEPAEQLMTVAEFLTWDGDPDTRYELVRGRVVAMAPVSANHSIIVSKIVGALDARLKRPCYVGSEAGVVRSDRDDTFYEADLLVSCTPVGPGATTISDPVVIVEVLSPTTIEHDRGRKAPDCRPIPSVQEIVLVSSEQRHVELWRRRGPKWELEDLIGDASLALEAVGVGIPLATIYAGAAFWAARRPPTLWPRPPPFRRGEGHRLTTGPSTSMHGSHSAVRPVAAIRTKHHAKEPRP